MPVIVRHHAPTEIPGGDFLAADDERDLDLGSALGFDRNLQIVPFTGAGRIGEAADWLTQAEQDAAVERTVRQVRVQERNRKVATNLKRWYNSKCMFCLCKLQVGNDPVVFYAEAAHIKPLGSPHDGPDTPSNMIVLCPNHHRQFDNGILTLRHDGGSIFISSKIPSDPLQNTEIHFEKGHRLDVGCVQWHGNWHAQAT